MGEGRSKDTLTQSDAAALCAGNLQRKCYLAGRLRWSLDLSVAAELEHYLWTEVTRTAAREKWILAIGQQTMRVLAGLAIAEMIHPVKYSHELCRVQFFGSGVKLPEDRVWKAWERTWRGRYQSAAWIPLERWTEVAASHISFRQRDDESEG